MNNTKSLFKPGESIIIKGQAFVVREASTADQMDARELRNIARVMRETGKSQYLILTKGKGRKAHLCYSYENGIFCNPCPLPYNWASEINAL